MAYVDYQRGAVAKSNIAREDPAGEMSESGLQTLVAGWRQSSGQQPAQSPFSDNTEEETGEDSYYAPPTSRAPVAEPLNYNPNDSHCLNDHTTPVFGTPTFLSKALLEGFQIGSFLMTLLSFNVVIVMAIASHMGKKMNPFHKDPPRGAVSKEWETRISGERFSSRVEYYANFFGYECEDVDVETEDGFVLRLHHLTSKKHKSLGHPVILQHGILTNSVTWVVNEERSLAFMLLERGYDVYLSNIRTNFKMPHRHFSRSDPRYWSWSIKEIGIYDLPAIVGYVNKRTGKKPAYVGHSQGASTMFLALSRGMKSEIGNQISSFIALGPAVYAGPVFKTFPFSLMRLFRARALWSLIFGVREFIPIMSLFQDLLPSWLFGHIASVTFGFIFNFHDSHWLNRQVPKIFRSTPVANSSELLYYYMCNLSYSGCVFDTSINQPWFPKSCPPVAIYYGMTDYLVLGKPLVDRLQNQEPNVRLIEAVGIPQYEHLDMIIGVNSHIDCFEPLMRVIEKTKNGYAAVGSRR